MRGCLIVVAATVGLSAAMIAGAATEEDASDFMQLHKVEITFHEAGTTKNLDLILSLFADDAVLTAGGKTYVRLSYLAPDIAQAIFDGRQPHDLTADKLQASSRLPLAWHQQRTVLGFA